MAPDSHLRQSRRTNVDAIAKTTEVPESPRSWLAKLFTILTLVFSLALMGCGGPAQDEQDNCYGDDMPVINEE
jgi:hypothetical protein